MLTTNPSSPPTDSQARVGGHDDTMLGTKKLWNPLSSIFRKINHPAPINQQESKRLLEALTASFRKNLDKEHGSPSAQSSSSNPFCNIANRPTDRHVRAILSNPLFSYDPTKTTAMPSDTSDPMAIFDRAVAKGLMTPNRAAGVLFAQRSVARSLSDEPVPSPDIALRVVQWLRSSGLERDLSFITNHRLISQLVPFMIEEGFEEIAWAWLDRWMRREGLALPHVERTNHADNLLRMIIRARATPLSSLDRGYVAMVRADDMFSHLREFEYAATGSWRLLSRRSTTYSSGRPQPSAALFDSFAAVSQHCTSHATLKLHRAHLDLYHPTHPDATLAVDYLQSSERVRLEELVKHELYQGQGQAAPQKTNTKLNKLIAMTADAARHLGQNGRHTDAEWVQGFLQRFRNMQSEHMLHDPTTLAT